MYVKSESKITQKIARDTTNAIKSQWQLTAVERLKFFIIILETVNPLTPNGAIMFNALNSPAAFAVVVH